MPIVVERYAGRRDHDPYKPPPWDIRAYEQHRELDVVGIGRRAKANQPQHPPDERKHHVRPTMRNSLPVGRTGWSEPSP